MVAPHYPLPKFSTIIEPFAGSAGYATWHFEHDVILIEKFKRLTEVWRFLIAASKNDIENLPLISVGETIDDHDLLSQPEKDFISFWLNAATTGPVKRLSKWARKYPNRFWSENVRNRIANQVVYIKHWRIIDGDYTIAPDVEATWFIDPPYEKAGKYYKNNIVNYKSLGEWSKLRRGQVIVCENNGATWLPFRPFRNTPGITTRKNVPRKVSKEVIWTNGV